MNLKKPGEGSEKNMENAGGGGKAEECLWRGPEVGKDREGRGMLVKRVGKGKKERWRGKGKGEKGEVRGRRREGGG